MCPAVLSRSPTTLVCCAALLLAGGCSRNAEGTAPTKTAREERSRFGALTEPESIERAWRELRKTPVSENRDRQVGELAGALARQNPDGAARLAADIVAQHGEGSREAYHFVSAFAAELASRDPAAAAAWAAKLPLTPKFAAYTHVAKDWAATDLRAAADWAESIPDPSLRAAVLRRISEVVETSGSSEAMSRWAERLAASADGDQQTATIARLLAAADVSRAFEWANQISDQGRRSEAVVTIAGAVANRDPRAAANWVDRFPASDVQRQAALVAAERWSEREPEAALRWLASKGDEPLLESGLQSVGRRWLAADPARATEWIRQAPVPDSVKRYLIGG